MGGNTELGLKADSTTFFKDNTVSDLGYHLTSISGTYTNIQLDSKYRVQSDGTNFYTKWVDDDETLWTYSWLNVASLTWNANTNPVSRFMHAIVISTTLGASSNSSSSINYQPILTVITNTLSPRSLIHNIELLI